MAGPIDIAYVEILPDLKKFDQQATQEINKALNDVAREADKASKKIGESISDSVKDGTDKSKVFINRLGQEIREVDGKITIKTVIDDKESIETLTRDIQGRLRKSNGKFVSAGELAGLGIAEGIAKGAGSGIGSLLPGIALPALDGALGAIKGPLIALGATLGTALAGALAPVAVALTAAIPAGVAVAGASITTLALAFMGLDDAVKNFDDDEKFQEALKNLSPAAARFATEMRSLVPVFKSIKDAAQEGFFKNLNGELTVLTNRLSGPLKSGFDAVGQALAELVRGFSGFVLEPTALNALQAAFKSTINIIHQFAPALNPLLTGISNIVIKALPFVEKLSGAFASFLDDVAVKLNNFAKNGSLDTFLIKAYDTLVQVASIGKDVAFILAQVFVVSEPGGQSVLTVIKDLTSRLAEFLSHKEAIQGITAAFTVLTEILLFNFRAMAFAADAGKTLGKFLAELIIWLGKTVDSVVEWGTAVGKWFGSAFDSISKFFSGIGTSISEGFNAVVNFFTSLPGLISSGVSSALSAIGDFFSAVGDIIVAGFNSFVSFLTSIPGVILAALMAAFKAVLFAIGVAIGLVLFVVTKLPGMILDALVALPGVLATFFTNLWNSVVQITVTTWNSVIAFIVTLPGIILNALLALWTTVSTFFINLWTTVETATISAWDSIVLFFTAIPGRIVAAVTSLVTILGDFFTNLWVTLKNNVISGWNSIIDFIKAVPGRIASFGDSFISAGKDIIRGFFSGLSSTGGFAGDVGRSIVNTFKSGLNFAIDNINSGINAVSKFVPGGLPTIPRVQSGGLITGSTLLQAGERGSELVLPLTGQRGRNAIQAFQDEAMGPDSQGGVRRWPSQQPAVEVNITIDSGGTKMDELLVQLLRKAVRVQGGNVQKVLGQGAVGVS